MALTDLAIRRLKPKDRNFKATDAGGLYLLVQPNGSKLWRMNYTFLGKQKTLSFGKYPLISLAEARERCTQARRHLSDGVDPAGLKRQEAERARRQAADTFAAVAEEYVESLRRRGLTEVTINKNRWILTDVVAPFIGDRPIAELRPVDILDMLREIEASGRIETAHRARNVVGAVFRLAALTDRATSDPTTALKGQLRPKKVRHRAAITNEARFRQLLRDIDGYRGYPTIRAGLLFLAYTFVRPGELRFATWDEIDMEDDVWRIPAERMKMRRPHEVPLTLTTRRILRAMGALTSREGYIFPSAQSVRKPLSENTFNKALAILGYKDEMTAHGFRSSASSLLNERGYRYDVIEHQLAHVEPNAVRRAYNRTPYWEERTAMMKDWARLLDKWRK